MNTVDENRVVKKKQSGKIRKKGQIDWMITLLPLGLIAALSILFFLLPEQSNTVLAKVRFFLGDTFGVYYLAIGLGVFLLSLYLAFSKYGDIVLGEQDEKPKYSFFAWGSMMFTLPHLGLCCTCGNGTGSGIQKPAVRLWENRRTASADD